MGRTVVIIWVMAVKYLISRRFLGSFFKHLLASFLRTSLCLEALLFWPVVSGIVPRKTFSIISQSESNSAGFAFSISDIFSFFCLVLTTLLRKASCFFIRSITITHVLLTHTYQTKHVSFVPARIRSKAGHRGRHVCATRNVHSNWGGCQQLSRSMGY